MLNIPSDDEDDMPRDPSLERGAYRVPFEHDAYWNEMPGGVWTPELEHKSMPIRKPTPGELADTERKRGGSEDGVCPVDPLLGNLDFTSEYISPKEEEKNFRETIKEHYEHIDMESIEDEHTPYNIDWDDEDW